MVQIQNKRNINIFFSKRSISAPNFETVWDNSSEKKICKKKYKKGCVEKEPNLIHVCSTCAVFSLDTYI